jgi:YHS domain-containing protein
MRITGMNTHTRVGTLLLLALSLTACAATPGRIKQDQPVPALEVRAGLALEGYDAVAYFDGGEPLAGTTQFTHQWQGATWRFASAAHRAAFAAAPERYAPQYGNYCAFAVSRGTTAHGDPKLWAIVDNRLYLNNNRFAQQLWNEDRTGNISAADQNWPLLPKTPLQ